jgi:cytochrome c-type biogenesis protein
MAEATHRGVSGGPRVPARVVPYLFLALVILIPALIFLAFGVSASGVDLEGAGGPLVAFSAGLLSFVSPCVLPLVPAYIGNLAGAGATAGGVGEVSRRRTFSHAVAYVLGFGVIFTALGASSGLVGNVLQDNLETLQKIAGVALIVMGLHLTGVIKIPALYRTVGFDAGAGRKIGYGRSFLVGSSFAIGWVPCIGPILGGILTLAGTSASAWTGTYLLLFYSLGLGIPFLLTGLAVSDASAFFRKIGPALPVIEIAAGILLVILGALIFLDEVTQINQYFDVFGVGDSI